MSHPFHDRKIRRKVTRLLNLAQRDYLECDGQTRVFAFLLSKANIPFKCYRGFVEVNGVGFPIHYWIQSGNWIIDFKLKQIFGEDAPHGVFRFNNYSDTQYDGQVVKLTTSEDLYNLLLDESFMSFQINKHKQFSKT